MNKFLTKRNILKILLIMLIILFLIITFIVIYNKSNKQEDNDYKEKIIENQSINNILFNNIKYYYQNEVTTISFDIVNKNNIDIKLNEFNVKIYNKDDILIANLNPKYEDVIKKDSTSNNFKIIMNSDLSYGYRLEFELPNLEFMEE